MLLRDYYQLYIFVSSSVPAIMWLPAVLNVILNIYVFVAHCPLESMNFKGLVVYEKYID